MSSARRSQPAFFLTVFSRYLRSVFFSLTKKVTLLSRILESLSWSNIIYDRPSLYVLYMTNQIRIRPFFLPFQQQQTNRFVIVPFLIANMHT